MLINNFSQRNTRSEGGAGDEKWKGKRKEWRDKGREKEKNCLQGIWDSGAIGHKSGSGVCIFNKYSQGLLMQIVLGHHILRNTNLDLGFVWTDWIVNGAMERGQTSELGGSAKI